MSKKYLFMINTLNVGGAETGLVELVNSMVDNYDCEVDILLTVNTGILKDRLSPKINVIGLIDKNNILKSIINAGIIGLTLIGVPANKYMYKDKYDYIIAYLEGYPSLFVSTLKSENKFSSIRVGLKDHATALDKLPWGKSMQHKMYSKFKKIHTVSEATKKEFVEKYPETSNRTVAITTGFEIDSIRKKGNVENPFEGTSLINIVTVGRIEEQKGYDILFESIYKLSLIRKDFRLHLIGNTNTDYARELKRNSAYNKLIEDEIIVLKGVKSNPYKYMKHSDFILTTSRYEGFPRVVNESLILNKFIIASNIEPNVESLGSEGVLVSLDTNAYVETINDVLSNKPYKGYNISKVVKTKETFTEEMIKFFEEE